MFRGPFQVRFDMSLAKDFVFAEKYRLRLNFNVFNLFNHPDFDAPNNDVSFFPSFEPPPVFPPAGSLGIIQHTIGSAVFATRGALHVLTASDPVLAANTAVWLRKALQDQRVPSQRSWRHNLAHSVSCG